MEDGQKSESGQSSGCCSANDIHEKQVATDETHEKPKDQVVEGDDDDDDDDDDEDDHDVETQIATKFVPGPLLPLKDQIEKDKDDESLRRWKEKLLGCLENDLDGQKEPKVIFHSIGIVSDDTGDISTPLPLDESRGSRVLFTLEEGSVYRLKLTFTVLHNIVSGLAYTNTVWKGGIQVDRSKGMFGTFAPQREPYLHTLEKQTTPSGVLARGTYVAKLKFEDDDRRCHMKLKFAFEINKSS